MAGSIPFCTPSEAFRSTRVGGIPVVLTPAPKDMQFQGQQDRPPVTASVACLLEHTE